MKGGADTLASESASRVERLFQSSFLTAGSNRIYDYRHLDVDGSQIGLCIARTVSLSVETIELIALDLTGLPFAVGSPKSRSLIDFLNSAARERSATVVWYVSPSTNAMTVLQEDSPKICEIGTNTFFRQIVTLPDNPLPLWLPEVFSEGDVISFYKRYQKRSAVALDLTHHTFARIYESVDDELARWAISDAPERPLILLGDRGAGKTWQLLRFCQEQQGRHKMNPWTHPPALYLSLRGVATYLADGHVSSLGLYALLAQRYAWFEVKWNVTMLQALLETGQLIICLDGLDEFGVDNPAAGVGDHLGRLIALIPRGSRFIITCRPTHFSSFAELASLETWPGSSVMGTMRVLHMQPFTPEDLDNYLKTVCLDGEASAASPRMRTLVAHNPSGNIVSSALQRCVSEPAILARIVAELTATPDRSDLQLLKIALEDSLISFNLEADRTSPIHQDADGKLRTFGRKERIAFLGELAWFMAERRLTAIDLENVPRRIARMFGVSSKALQRDIRSQTVFQLDDFDNRPAAVQSEAEREASRVRFALRFDDSQDVVPPKTTRSSDTEKSHSTPSVANAYFLAAHIARRLGDRVALPGVDSFDVLQYVGRVELDELTAAILRQHLDVGTAVGYSAESLATEVKSLMRQYAQDGRFKIFDRAYRFLVPNAVRMGLFEQTDASRIDPWTSETAKIVAAPRLLPDYELVLVPPASHNSPSKPYLLGLHEVTNRHFYAFIESALGDEWSVERIRLSSLEQEPSVQRSPNADFTNEYHLYCWTQHSTKLSNTAFAPPVAIFDHPVVYVSLYAAEAFCAWLNGREDYKGQDTGFRLPSAAEWCWAAQSGHKESVYPWELLPYAVPSPADETGTDAASWFRRYRDAVKHTFLDVTIQTSEVGLDDELSPQGIMGLIGNVKEWVGDRVSEEDQLGKWKAMVYGGTAHLGPGSFAFNYHAPLFPENTNPDVGFRIARHLTEDEYVALKTRESQIASQE